MAGWLHRELNLLGLALQFFTRVPVPAGVAWSEAAMHDSARYFPLVGLGVGLFAAACWGVAAAVWNPSVAAWLALAATVWLTGAFHEDGWADTCDALGGQVSRERALVIMKDSRIGSYGAIGLVLMLGLKAAVLATLPPLVVPLALVWAHTSSRVAPLLLMRLLPYAGDAEHAKAKPLARKADGVALAAAGLTLLAVGVGLSAVPAWAGLGVGRALAVMLAASAASTAGCRRWFRLRLGGYTGDTLGASQQLAEAAALLAALAWALHA